MLGRLLFATIADTTVDLLSPLLFLTIVAIAAEIQHGNLAELLLHELVLGQGFVLLYQGSFFGRAACASLVTSWWIALMSYDLTPRSPS